MSDRTALTAGIAAASIAAVVAASPALITPPNNDVQVTASAASAMATKKLSTDVQLVAFTLPGLFDAFLNGYSDPEGRYFDDLVQAGLDDSGLTPGSDDYLALEAALEDQYTLPGISGAIYYTLDSSLPASFDYDDAFSVLGVKGLLDLLASDLGIADALPVSFVFDPAGTALGVLEDLGLGAVGDFLADPTSVLPPEVAGLLANPAVTVVLLANALGVLPDVAANFLLDPAGTVFDVAEGLGVDPIVRAFVTDPIGTVLGALTPQQALAFKGTPTEEISTLETKAPKLVNLKLPKLPTPAEVVSQIESNVDSAVTDFKAAITPKKADKVEVQTLVSDDAADEDAPKPEKAKKIDFDGPVATLAKGVSKSLKAAAEKRDEKRAERVANAKEKHAERVASFKKKFGGSDDSDK